jgi:hypothetical protein
MLEVYSQPKRLGQWNQTRGAWETDNHDLLSTLSEPFLETWPAWGMTLDGVAFALPMQGHPTDDTASSSLLKTPTAQLAVNGGSQHPDKRRAGGHGPTLADEVEYLLPTPAAMNPNDGEDITNWQERRKRVKAEKKNGNGFGMPLAIAVRLLPTPVASEGTKATTLQGSAEKALTGQVWLTNIAHDLAVLNGAHMNPRSDVGSKS